MALQINKDLKNGFIASYAVITRLVIDFIAKTSIMNLSYYKDLASHDSGLDPVGVDTPEFNGPDFIFDPVALKNASPLDLAYPAIAALPDFQGSVVVPDTVKPADKP
jgi:hypothetical protein